MPNYKHNVSNAKRSMTLEQHKSLPDNIRNKWIKQEEPKTKSKAPSKSEQKEQKKD